MFYNIQGLIIDIIKSIIWRLKSFHFGCNYWPNTPLCDLINCVLQIRVMAHIHAHVPGLSLAQIFFWSHNLETAEHIPVLFPELLDVLLMVNLLSREPILIRRLEATYEEPCMVEIYCRRKLKSSCSCNGKTLTLLWTKSLSLSLG